MLTGVQVRMARVALNMSADTLAEKAGVASKTIRRIESAEGIPTSSAKTIASIQTALETAGIEFIGSPEDAPGIRIHPRPTTG
ncbi:MAG TPA: transcriptional regulator [Rhodobacter sp.]|nr:transcriptional regulator [Rhodobacter sp.]